MRTDTIAAGDPSEIADRLLHRFAELHGREAAGCFAAPGRVNLIGEHVDYNDGRCLPLALPHATYAALAPRTDDVVQVTSLQQDQPWTGRSDELGPGCVDGWAAYVAGVVWALQQAGVELPGLDILVDSRVPVGAGLSSSAALECSVALGLCAVAGLEADERRRLELVRACMRAETEVAGAPTGGMDQTVSLLADAGHALLLDCRDWTTEQVPWAADADGIELLVVDTRASHALTDGGYESRRRTCEDAAKALEAGSLREVADPLVETGAGAEDLEAVLARLDDDTMRRRVRHVLTEMGRVTVAVEQLRAADFAALGATFDASHASLRDDFEVSCAELDAVTETALAHGALGARMTGGGFGGSAIALVPVDRVDAVTAAVAETFAERDWKAPGFLRASAGDGARRIR